VVGLSVVHSDANNVFLATRVGQLSIHLKRADRQGASGLTFEIAPDEDMADLVMRLAAAGIAAEVRSDSAPGIVKAVAFRDPIGNSIELFSGLKFLGRSAPAGADPVKFGHAAFIVSDPKQMVEFYGQILGFSVSDWIKDFFVFMRCGQDHHTVNFLRHEGGNRVHHIAFEMRDNAHLIQNCDLLAANKVNILWGPVRHGPGHNVATYHAAPDGHMIEFFSELDQIVDEKLGYFDPRPWHEDLPQRPKVWEGNQKRDVWGPPGPADFLSRAP
jgi:catechol 2,3-dioxygenase-like lactoylglutathione lyase family enzyme